MKTAAAHCFGVHCAMDRLQPPSASLVLANHYIEGKKAKEWREEGRKFLFPHTDQVQSGFCC